MVSRRQHRGGILRVVLIAAFLQGALAAAAAPPPATAATEPHKDSDRDKDKGKAVDLKPCVSKCIEQANSGCRDAADTKCLCPATASQKHLVQDVVTCIQLSDDDECAVVTATDAVLLLGPLESACDALGKPIPSSVLIGAANAANTVVVPPDSNKTTKSEPSSSSSSKTKTAPTSGGGDDDEDDKTKTSTATAATTTTTPRAATTTTTTPPAAVDTAKGPTPSASTQDSATSVITSDPREPTDSSPFATPNNSSEAWRRMASPSLLGLVLGLAGAILLRI